MKNRQPQYCKYGLIFRIVMEIQSNETLKQTIETTKENYKNSKLYSKEQEGKDQQSIMNTVDYIQKHHENIIVFLLSFQSNQQTMANKLAQFAREKQSNALQIIEICVLLLRKQKDVGMGKKGVILKGSQQPFFFSIDQLRNENSHYSSKSRNVSHFLTILHITE